MKVIFSTAARGDLAEIEDYKRARSFVDELIDRSEELAVCRVRLRSSLVTRAPAFARRSHKGYLIFHVIRGDTIEVLHVIRLLSRREDDG